MSNKKIKYFLLLILCISICTLNLNAQYIPSFSFDTNLCLSQNRTLKNNDLPLRTSGNFELRLKPVAFRFNNNLIVDWDFSIATNSQTAVWHNTVLLGFNTIGTSVNVGAQFDFYALTFGLGFNASKYYYEDSYFFSLSALINNKFFLTKYFAISIPLEFTYRKELFDYKIGFGLCCYPMGGKR